jgi:acetyltransferase EpsM
MKRLVIIGGTGNGTVAASTVEDINAVEKEWEIIGFLNDFETGPIVGFPVLGKIDYATAQKLLEDDEAYFLYTLISTKLNFKFLHRLTELEIPIERFATIIHPTAVISRFAKIGYGVSIQPFVSVGPGVTIGNHIQMFAQSLIGHDSTLDDYSYVANNACVGAHVHLKEGTYLGTNCSLLENITLGEWSLVGMGAVVLKDVPPYTKVVGNPARVIGKVE